MSKQNEMLTFGGHLEVFRKMLFRIIGVASTIAIVTFCFKDDVFAMILAPSECDFCTYKWIEGFIHLFDSDFHFEAYHIKLIATDLSSQFMTHVTTSCYIGILGASPFILYELFRFVSPALYENERKYSLKVVVAIYFLFILGVLMCYFILFPIAFRFLGTYSVSNMVNSTITLDSYIDTFTSLILLLGIAFQLPVIAFFLAKLGVISYDILVTYRRHAIIIIALFAAIITPPDIMTLILVAIPLYLLFEVSIHIVRISSKRLN